MIATSKHYLKLHDQDDHGRRKREGIVREAQAKDYDLWEGYPSEDFTQIAAVKFMGDIVSSNGKVIADSSGKAQAGYLMKINNGVAVLEYLAVAPWHLEKEGARGWGTAAFYEVAKNVLSSNADELTLVSATRQSNAFYDGIGMTKIGKERDEDQAYSISRDGLQRFIDGYEFKNKTSPRD